MKERLLAKGLVKWLDLGSSKYLEEGFMCADIIPEDQIVESLRGRYIYWNANLPPTKEQKQKLGSFDLIRMQHVFEHFSPEEGVKVLQNVFDLLNPGGYLLITVPDLKVFIRRYKYGLLHYNWSFNDWALTRIAQDAPQSFYFSVFTHSVPHQSHQWCYDKEGLKYQIKKSINTASLQFLSVFHPLASIPFTHNRPLEDLCVLIRKNSASLGTRPVNVTVLLGFVVIEV